ncbi:MAG: 16S rRNA (cytidine(1402)-2'-O)-methyltransferase [Candidatus Nealsonbacteria bacterium CG23_combo_of_CG06-09_8_20_14_all_39_25]|uniref:Ribosomal RNA small subunit methyltransferase I n=1 Tax=Candidatus Nealsonbacteria bacterium CG23_combo_of_CG06-09_8_20_14_all_39_25 TaxID=1974723 RepID=A0A2G9YTC4_9BACT|nr:MAG: 16S rRNA (cytidine(1402)-2'-O)-methyltransferase [Candidatus Nealsonbacteria bacterium CG23_combo_of_CG06-09_8_20_14_all_39_25]
MPTLYIVATPIGNLEDVSKRALRVLSEVDLILCEDTRVTKKLLDHYGIKTSTFSYHQHSKLQKIEYIIQLLKQGKNLALVSDAGTPGISDPGGKLIEEAIDLLGDQIKITSVPGPSAITAAASVSGFPTDKFLFMGFPPTKKKRKRFFEEIINSKYPVIFYESPHRILKSLCDLRGFTQIRTQIRTDREIVVCRELTKKFETIYRGEIDRVIKEIERGEIKGEFVVVVEGKK